MLAFLGLLLTLVGLGVILSGGGFKCSPTGLVQIVIWLIVGLGVLQVAVGTLAEHQHWLWIKVKEAWWLLPGVALALIGYVSWRGREDGARAADEWRRLHGRPRHRALPPPPQDSGRQL
jgi:hypothetical protein